MKLVFVYNAKSDRLSKMFDFAHKIVSPSTYACDLCSLTHGNFGEREEWTAFTEESEIEMDFHHIEDFESKYDRKEKYPIVFSSNDGKLTTLLNSEEIAGVEDVAKLVDIIKTRISDKTNSGTGDS